MRVTPIFAGTCLFAAALILNIHGQAGGQKAFVNATNGLVLRSEASQKGKKLGMIPDGTIIEAVGETGPEEEIAGKKAPWIKIRWNGKEGWAFGGFMSQNAGKCMSALTQLKTKPGILEDMQASGNLSYPERGLSLRLQPDGSGKFEFDAAESGGRASHDINYKLLNARTLAFTVVLNKSDAQALSQCEHEECEMASDRNACTRKCQEKSGGSVVNMDFRYTLNPAQKNAIFSLEKTKSATGKKAQPEFPYNTINKYKTTCVRELVP